MSATEQMRAMLDGLMGTARDGSDSQRQHLHFSDSRVCRAFLLDCCPHDIFTSTKLELGECNKVHDPALRADYLNSNKNGDYSYEAAALERLQNFVNEADKKTEYLKRKLAETQEELTAEKTSKLNKVYELIEKLGQKLVEVDNAEASGDLVSKQKLIEESEKIRQERALAEAEFRKISRPASSHQQQNLRICDICSAYLGINDNDSRLADHFGGKLHLGYITIREKLEDLKRIVAEKRGSSRRGAGQSERSSTKLRGSEKDRHSSRDKDFDHDRASRDYDRYRTRDYERYREREWDRARESRDSRDARDTRDSRESRDTRDTRDRYHRRERERSRSSSGYYRSSSGRYRDERIVDERDDREVQYQRRLREWEKRESDKSRKYASLISEDRDRKQLEEQESRKLKQFLEDYKDDRDDIRFYRGSALNRRLADRRKEIEQDELSRQKEKMELEILSRSCAPENSSPQPIECVNDTETEIETNNTTTTTTTTTTLNPITCDIKTTETATIKTEPIYLNPSSTSSKVPASGHNKGSSSEEKRKQVEELINRIPTDKDQLFARQLDWSLLDENLMEKRIRPWVTKKIAEYMGEKEVDLIDFVCTLLNAHTDGSSMLREVAIVLDDEAEKFVVHMWRLLIFELEAKKIGLRK